MNKEDIPEEFRKGPCLCCESGEISVTTDGVGWYFWLRDGQWPPPNNFSERALCRAKHAVGFARQLANVPIDKRMAAFDAMPDVKKKGGAKPSPQIDETRPKGEAKEPVLSEDKPERATNPIFDQLKIAEVMLRGVYQYRNPAALIFTGPPGIGKSTVVRKIKSTCLPPPNSL